MPDWQKKYRWTHTWPEEGGEDWCAWDGDTIVGRVMLDKTTLDREGWYLWSGQASTLHLKHRLKPQTGWTKEPWEAAKAAEDWWDEMKRLNGLGAGRDGNDRR